jgi:membrane-bound inhibitor of C-type lysozyme
LLVVAVAGACSREPLERRSPVGQTHSYLCSDGYRFVVRFEPQRAWLFLDSGTTSVPQVPTRSGLLYTNRMTTFAVEGKEARLRVAGESAEHTRCVNQPAEAERSLK